MWPTTFVSGGKKTLKINFTHTDGRTIHKITANDLEHLDSHCKMYIKTWAGVSRGGTNLIFHVSQSMNIPTIASLYEEEHFRSHSHDNLRRP